MKKTAVWFVLPALLVAVPVGYYLYRPAQDALIPATTSESLKPAPTDREEAKARYPIAASPPAPQQVVESTAEAPVKEPVVPPAVVLPSLDSSDRIVTEEFGSVTGRGPLSALFNVNDFIRRVVVTVDNLPRRQVPPRYIPTAPVSGRFTAQGEEGNQYLSPENFKRYTVYVQLLESVSVEGLVDVYVYLYPLFQEAYDDLGYPNAYFNDRVVEAIDDLLATPAVQKPIKLARPSVMFKYDDPELEALSAGQKIMIRMGPNNAARVKARLSEIRQVLMRRVATEIDPRSAAVSTTR